MFTNANDSTFKEEWAIFRESSIDELKQIICGEFEEIQDCLGVLQLTLQKEHKEVVNNLKTRCQLDDSEIQYYQILSDTLPNMLRRTFFIAIFSRLEQSLEAICNELKVNFRFITKSVKDLKITDNKHYKILEKGSDFKRYKIYLEKVVKIEFPGKYWETIIFYKDLRNNLIHSGIRIDDTPKGNKLKKKIEKRNGVSCDRHNVIQFSQEFLTNTLVTILEFLLDIFRALEPLDEMWKDEIK